MTNTTGTPTPAGWYPVAPGSSQLRWWDGAAWTDHVHDQAVGQVGGALKAPAGTNPNTLWIWLVVLSPIYTVMGIFFVNFKAYADAVLNTTGTSPGAEFAGIAASGYFTYIGLGFLGYLLTVLFAALDWRRLKLNGVPRPFHWAWAFLGQSIVYMIGRSVVVHRRTNRGLAPLWVWIAVYVVAIVIVSTVAVGAMADAVQQLGQFGNP